MVAFLGRRMVQFVLVVIGTSSIVFIALFVVSDPVRTMMPLGTSEQRIEEIRSALGFDAPVLEQYLHFLGNAVTGDFGTSLWLQEPAFSAALIRLPITAFLAVTATLLGAVLGTVLGTAAALRPGSVADRLISALSYVVLSVPHFWIGMMLILWLSVGLGILPTSGFEPDIQHVIMPVCTLSLVPLGHVAQMVRSLMIEESHKSYVTQALANGQSDLRVATHQQLRNVGLPVVTIALYDLAHIFVGEAVIVEVLFSWPGLGRLAVGALERGDIFLVQAVVIIGAAVIALINLAADLVYSALDPRVRKTLLRKGKS